MDAPPADPRAASEAEARRALARQRGIATGLLVLMAVLTIGSFYLPPGWWAELLQASAKAGFVGGLADWFAVTALFRHPLGIPIPHTAIIPAQKARLGQALGRFVANYVFTEAEVTRTLSRLDLAGILSRFLSDPAATRPAAVALASLVPKLLTSIEDGRAKRVLRRLVPRMVSGPGTGRLVGRALHGLMEGGRHQDVFSFILGQLKSVLAEREASIKAAIAERVREQGGRLVGWAIGASVAARVMALINAELAKIEPGSSDVRAAFDEWMAREITRIEEEPERAAELGRAVRRFLAHETIQNWLWDVWTRARAAMAADAVKPNGRSVALIETGLRNLGDLLETDPKARATLQQALEGIVMTLLPAGQVQVSDFIAGAVANWDAATLTERLELRVGRDLQYVRINGTLVGFLAGGLVWAALTAMFGHVSF
ncbi:MAG TPA: DUF445 domain-containing protein [Acetobacteraceae bacterium]|nr:DUF445 domain-containing protein [Acetobacteraceae bacterium]